MLQLDCLSFYVSKWQLRIMNILSDKKSWRYSVYTLILNLQFLHHWGVSNRSKTEPISNNSHLHLPITPQQNSENRVFEMSARSCWHVKREERPELLPCLSPCHPQESKAHSYIPGREWQCLQMTGILCDCGHIPWRMSAWLKTWELRT